jgi:hypothetical protein
MSQHIPAICDTCGTAFPSGIVMGPESSVTMVGNKAGPCPNCGGMGRIPDGFYKSVNNALHLITKVRETEQLRGLQVLLEKAQRDNLSRNELSHAIETTAPAFGALRELLPNDRSELYNFVSMILAALALLVSLFTSRPDAPAPSVTQIFNTISSQGASQGNGVKRQRLRESKKQHRNAPCACGSGKKYKQCCGKS